MRAMSRETIGLNSTYVIAAQFNGLCTDKLRSGALKRADERGTEVRRREADLERAERAESAAQEP